jgi:hypothetical protein
LSAKLPDISRPQFPLSLLEVSRVVGDVEAPGGTSVNFQSRVNTISLNGCGTSVDISLRGPTEEEEEEEEEEKEEEDDDITLQYQHLLTISHGAVPHYTVIIVQCVRKVAVHL